MQQSPTWKWLAILTAAMLLSGCTGPWNDPNPPTNQEQITYFGSFITRPKHLDPVRSYSAEEAMFIDQIYDPPLQYHFLKRPYELEPATAATIPSLELLDEQLQPLPADSKEAAFSQITIRLKPNTRYQPHPAFAEDDSGNPLYVFSTTDEGAPYKLLADFPVTGTRNLTADDYIYQIKRMADPVNKSPLLGLISGYIVGMKAFEQWAKNNRQPGEWLDLRQQDMEGLEKIDDLTFAIRIKGIYPQFQYWLAMHFFAPVPWEADRFYHNPGFPEKNLTLDWNPIGTGPFMMTVNSPNREIVLERNPNYRKDFYPSEGSENDLERGYLADAGKPLPFIAMKKRPPPCGANLSRAITIVLAMATPILTVPPLTGPSPLAQTGSN